MKIPPAAPAEMLQRFESLRLLRGTTAYAEMPFRQGKGQLNPIQPDPLWPDNDGLEEARSEWRAASGYAPHKAQRFRISSTK